MKKIAPSLPAAALGLLCLTGSPTQAANGPWSTNPEARVRLVAASGYIGLDFELAPGWHVYWKNSGDAGYPPRLDFSDTPEILESRLLFPAPRRFELPGGLVSFGYENRVLYPVGVTLAPESGKTIAVRARLDYLVCREECIPYTAALALDLPREAIDADPEAPEITSRLAAARAALPMDPASVPGAPRLTFRVEPGRGSMLALELEATGGSLRAAAPDLFFETHSFFALERPVFSVSAAGLRFRVPFRPLDETRAMPATTTFAWTLTGLERFDGVHGANLESLALSSIATVQIPALRTSDDSPADSGRTALWIPALAGALGLALFLLYRSRRAA